MQPDYLITVDVGNSRNKFGLFETAPPHDGLPRCLQATATGVKDDLPWNVVRGWQGTIAGARVEGVVAGANPAGVQRVTDTWPSDVCSPPHIIAVPTGFPIHVELDAPEKVGIDRLLNAVAANSVREPAKAAVIVSTGPATTVDCVSADGAFIGGAILPGFELSATALHRYTALLPLISIDELATEPHRPIGKNTREALRSGLLWGQLGAVRELVARYSAERGEPQLFLTGGGAPLLAPELPAARWEPHLALQGLVLVTLAHGAGSRAS